MKPTSPFPAPSPWLAEDFAPVAFTGAAKLAGSGIAPLVALARGYETVLPEEVRGFADRERLGNSNSKRRKLVTAAAARGDILVIPSYGVDDLRYARSTSRMPQPTHLYLRTVSRALEGATTVRTVYEQVSTGAAVVDSHPATPVTWLEDAPRTLITGSVLQGDSALTALLLTNGCSREDLGAADLTHDDAVARLHALMSKIPDESRMNIFSFRVNGDTHTFGALLNLELANRVVLLTFDNLIGSDWSSWSQANRVWQFLAAQQAMVKLVDLTTDGNGTFIDMDKQPQNKKLIRIDDYLTRHGSWPDLLANVRDVLPEVPDRSRNDAEAGTWAVSEDGSFVEQLVQTMLPEGQVGPAEWTRRVGIGGRVAAVVEWREPTQSELLTGEFRAGVDEDDPATTSTCLIELHWFAEDGTPVDVTVAGPAAILGHAPRDWDWLYADLPSKLLEHPEWPPKHGWEWVKAIKGNNALPAASLTAWTVMGWVPVEGSPVCSYISGNTVISADPAQAKSTRPGVTERVLPGSSGFSLPPHEPVVMSAAWQKQVRADLTALRQHHIELAPWTDINTAAIVIAAGLRPTVPQTTHTTLYLQGNSGAGKSWTASQILAFHQARGTWTHQDLPGSMQDTATAVEQAIAQTNVWVMDDLAPTSHGDKYSEDTSKIGDIIRSVYNGAPKRRSGPDLKARRTFTPSALFVVTAENDHSIYSVRDRVITVRFESGSIREGTLTAMNAFRDENHAAARLTAASVQAFQHIASTTSWTAMQEGITATRKEFEHIAEKAMAASGGGDKSSRRHSEMASDLMLGLAPLRLLAELVHDDDMLVLLDPTLEDNLLDRVAQVVAGTYRDQSFHSPGATLVGALKAILRAGHAHILNGTDPSEPPLPREDKAGNRALGWQSDGDGNVRPLKMAVGHLVAPKDGLPTDVILFDRVNSFNEAQKRFPGMLPPGTISKGAFQSAWGEELTHSYWRSKGADTGRLSVRVGSGAKQRGVPFHLDDITGDK